MSRNKLLSLLGLFVRSQFLTLEECSRLRHAMLSAPARPAEVYDKGSNSAVDEVVRRALTVDLPVRTCEAVERALDDVRGELARHFSVALAEREPPHYLVYGPGAFFTPHRDRQRPPHESSNRQVSVVVFLSAPRSLAADGYTGGDLNFYGLIDDPRWEGVGLGCDVEPGLLLAFRADTLHEVTPVTAGQRCTIVTWFG